MAEGGQRIAADKAWLSQRYGVRGWLQQRIDWLTYALADLLTDAEQPIALRFDAGAMAPRQVLLVTAGGDRRRAGGHVDPLRTPARTGVVK